MAAMSGMASENFKMFFQSCSSDKPPKTFGHTLELVLTTSEDYIPQQSKDLLLICSFLSPNSIPLSLLGYGMGFQSIDGNLPL